VKTEENVKSKSLLAAVSLVAFALFATASVSTLVAIDQSVPAQLIELAGDDAGPGGG